MNSTMGGKTSPLPGLLWEISAPGRSRPHLPGFPEAATAESGQTGSAPGAAAAPETATRPGTAAEPELLRHEPPDLPEVSELELVRHYTRLSQANFSIDTHFYPLGSCTMKYNPKVNDRAASAQGFTGQHPLEPEELSQGSLELMWRLQGLLERISGFERVSLQPAAGAQGELSGVLMIRAYHESRGETARKKMLIPDSAHGTNPASVAMAGFEAVQIPTDEGGNADRAAVEAACGPDVAGIMITNPNTLGLFEAHIREVIDTVHACGGLVYGDGANLNAILGVLRPADLDIDVMHFNLHKTFSTPHGGGGPGAGPVGAGPRLSVFLPGPIVTRNTGGSGGDGRHASAMYRFEMPSRSIGRLKSFHGNFGVLVRAFTYILMHGGAGLRAIAENAVLNANYLKARIADIFPAAYERSCMHEFVASGKIGEVETMDVAKRLLDYGFHAPTVYFPLIVKDALMIEPTESETRETLDAFADTLRAVTEEARRDPDLLHGAPHQLPLQRLDEVKAARELVLCFRPS
jgi:glycine dehydrogenase subunit 2